MSERIFEAKDAARQSVPLLVGLFGASGSGKTMSALRLATGIQSVAGGDIFAIDTEARRMLHYADRYRFKHIQFDAPFGSLDYLAAIRQSVKAGASVVIVDSMSHEHSSEGGYLSTQAYELDRMAGDDYGKRERVKMAAWIKPAQYRSQMINGLLQLNANLIFCYRAKEKTKPVRNTQGKTEIKEMGFMPIAGDELLYEMTVNCMLLPQSNGVPTWESNEIGERMMMKLPEQFKALFRESRALDEDTGVALATWARGDEAPDPLPAARDAAALGKDALQAHWKGLDKPTRARVQTIMDELTKTATEADAVKARQTETADVI